MHSAFLQERDARLAEAGGSRPLYVAAFSSKDSRGRRRALRKSLQQSGTTVARSTRLRFFLCGKKSGPAWHWAHTHKLAKNPSLQDQELHQEAVEHKDIVLLGCEDGTVSTLLTKKLALTLQAYQQETEQRHESDDPPMFVKVTDDTFVAWHRLRRSLSSRHGEERDFAYLGVSVNAGHFVNRDPKSPWYQPEDIYPNKSYPCYMEAAPGYVLGGALVHSMLQGRFPQEHILSNEDQALGVWVDGARRHGAHVAFGALLGADEHKLRAAPRPRTWGEYKFVLHHSMKTDAIECLARADAKNESSEALGGCFADRLFVAVFSKRSSFEQRSTSRTALRAADDGHGHVVAKFAMCNHGTDGLDANLTREEMQHSDLLLLNCNEGEAFPDARLGVKKLLMAMEAYRSLYGSRSHFMKIDDATFVAWKSLQRALGKEFDSHRLFMSAAGDGFQSGRASDRILQGVVGNPGDEGAPAFIMGRELVERILDRGIPDQDTSATNEDAALAAWLGTLRKQGAPVHFAQFGSSTGDGQASACYHKWREYRDVVRQGLDRSSLSCLAKAAEADSPDYDIEDCFADCEGQTMRGLQSSLDLIIGEVGKTSQGMRIVGDTLGDVRRGIDWLAAQHVAKRHGAEARRI